MNFFYAQLNENFVVEGVSELGGENNLPNMIRLTEEQYASRLLGWTYSPKTKAFIPPPESSFEDFVPEPQLDDVTMGIIADKVVEKLVSAIPQLTSIQQ